jgi:heterodisulfide reductase subunit C
MLPMRLLPGRLPGLRLHPQAGAQCPGQNAALKEVMDGNLPLDDQLVESLFQCTTCASCFKNCPSGVEVPEIIKQVRKDMVNIGSCHPAFEGMHKVLQNHTNIYGEDEPEDFERERNKRPNMSISSAAWGPTGKMKQPLKPWICWIA